MDHILIAAASIPEPIFRIYSSRCQGNRSCRKRQLDHRAAASFNLMISECFNPLCRAKLNYLRDGRVVRLIHKEPDGIRIEHFWLCGVCYTVYDFRFKQDGTLSIVRQSSVQRPEETHPEFRWIEEELAS